MFSKKCSCDLMILLGRICLSLMFVIAGITKLMHYDDTLAGMVKEAVPYADIMLIGAIVFELIGGLLVLIGWKTRFGALLLVLFIIPVTFYYHDFWLLSGEEMTAQVYHFLKNLTIVGGLLYVMSFGPGKYSVDKG